MQKDERAICDWFSISGVKWFEIDADEKSHNSIHHRFVSWVKRVSWDVFPHFSRDFRGKTLSDGEMREKANIRDGDITPHYSPLTLAQFIIAQYCAMNAKHRESIQGSLARFLFFTRSWKCFTCDVFFPHESPSFPEEFIALAFEIAQQTAMCLRDRAGRASKISFPRWMRRENFGHKSTSLRLTCESLHASTQAPTWQQWWAFAFSARKMKMSTLV